MPALAFHFAYLRSLSLKFLSLQQPWTQLQKRAEHVIREPLAASPSITGAAMVVHNPTGAIWPM